MSDDSNVYFAVEGDRGAAYARDVFLCSVELSSYHGTQRVRELFAELVAAVTAHRRREVAAGAVNSVSRLAGLPCEVCTLPQADDVRRAVAQVADASELVRSPGGLPLNCCRVHTLGARTSQAVKW
jgi:hypothetical protein